MASKNSSGGGAPKGGEGGGTALALPEGYSTGRSSFYAEAVRRSFEALPPRGGSVRLLLVASKDTTGEQVRELLGSPRHQLERKAPGMFAATLTAQDMELKVGPNVGAGKMLRWIDMGTRFYGVPVEDADATATVAVSYEGLAAEAKKKLASLGMTVLEPKPPEGAEPGEWVNPDEGLLLGTIRGGKLYDLALTRKATSIEVRGVERAGAQQ